ncbi:MAG: TrkH family potassium uptake protein [Coriobacteriales bacterium]|jgi:trk system potassium uptake protein TrkH|nr:TrkH family potassium uptake protein [Coriobacteriales bacterium]
MWPRFSRPDIAIIAHYLGTLTLLLAAAMLAPLLVSVLMQEWAIACNYVLGIGIALTLGALMQMARARPGPVDRKQAIAITGFIWIIGALVAAVPLYLSGHYTSFLDAFFEGVSGLTATGLTLVQDVDHMSLADNMWRSTMQFLGGQGVIVVALSLGLFTRTGAALYISEGRSEAIVPNIKATARFIWQFAATAVLIGTIILGCILLTIGVDPLRSLFHGLWITIGAYDTGGFAPSSLSLISYHSWPFEMITMLIMMFGAVNFALFAQLNRGNWRLFLKDIEIRTLALWITGMVILFVAALSLGDFLTDYTGLARRGIFTIVSATTNTGYQLLSTNQMTTLFSSGAFLLLAISMAIGGSSASTAGGIKALRVGLICKGIALRVKSLLSPRSAEIGAYYTHIGRHRLNPELLSSALIIASLYVISYIIGTLLGIACGYGAVDAVFESISAASNAGLSSGITAPEAPVLLKLCYIAQMWMGRLEFLTLLALLASLLASLLPDWRGRKGRPGGDWRGKGTGTSNKGAGHDTSRLMDSGRSGGAVQAKHTKAASRLMDDGRPGKRGRAVVPVLVVLALVLLLTLVPFWRFSQAAYATTPSLDGELAHGEVVDRNDVDGEFANGEVVDSSASNAQHSITITELSNAASHLDNQKVDFTGEVVGDIITADNGNFWVTLNDGSASISVYVSASDVANISSRGGYQQQGTVLDVRGEFHLACGWHDGLSDVHASSFRVVEAGGPIAHLPNLPALALGLFLAACGLVLIGLHSILARKKL